ncbi:MAG: ribosome maturation factor RimP [Clostridia bacterium]|nr:ribosome maturation factor RimP [Clostridia bacterium]
MRKTCEIIEELALPVAENLGLSIWDVEFVKEGGQHYLRVFLDKEGGVDIDDCETFSRAFDPILDREDPIAESYVFEVCSAGLERTLKRPRDFEAYIGHLVEVRTFAPRNGTREFVGVLDSYLDGTVTVKIGDKCEQFAKKEIATARLRIEF